MLRSAPKTILAQTLISEVPICPPQLEATNLEKEDTLIIDGQALVYAIGKPQTAVIFGELADVFIGTVLWSGADFKELKFCLTGTMSFSSKDEREIGAKKAHLQSEG
jgi:hypothetical protein